MALHLTGSINISGSISGSVSGSFQGDGSKLTGIGSTNPTTGSMPLNISGAFVDSVITQVAGTTSTISTIAASHDVPLAIVGDSANNTVVITDPNTTIVKVGDTATSNGFGYSDFPGFGGSVVLGSFTGTVTNVTGNDITIAISHSPSNGAITATGGSVVLSRTNNTVIVSSDLTVSGSIDIHSGSITVTPSIVNQLTASYALTASHALNDSLNPSTGSIPLNISGAFVDSPITSQQGGQVVGGTQFALDNVQFSEFNPGLNPGDQCNFNFQNTLTLGTIGDPVIWQVTTELNSGDGTVIPVGVYTGTITVPANNTIGLSAIFSNDSGWVVAGGTIPAPASSAGILGVTSTLSVASVTTLGNLYVGGTIGGVGESTITLTPSEINQITFANGTVNSKGNVDYINFNVANATNLVDNQTYSAVTLGSSTNYPSNDPSTYTREWVYLAEGNADLNLGVGNSILYTDNPSVNIIYDDTGNRSLNDYNSPAGLGQLDVATAVGSGGALTTAGDITVTGNITAKSNIILTGGDNVTLQTINYSQVGSGFESDILSTGGATTDVVYLTFNTGSGVGLEDGQTYSVLIYDDGISKTFTTDWIYIDENNSDRSFPVGESRLYAYENGATYYDDSNSSQFTTLAAPNSYEVSPKPGTLDGNAATATTASYAITASHALNAGGAGGATINPTDNAIPVRSNATTFIDSHITSVGGTEVLATLGTGDTTSYYNGNGFNNDTVTLTLSGKTFSRVILANEVVTIGANTFMPDSDSSTTVVVFNQVNGNIPNAFGSITGAQAATMLDTSIANGDTVSISVPKVVTVDGDLTLSSGNDLTDDGGVNRLTVGNDGGQAADGNGEIVFLGASANGNSASTQGIIRGSLNITAGGNPALEIGVAFGPSAYKTLQIVNETSSEGAAIEFEKVSSTVTGKSVSSKILVDYEEGSWTPTSTLALQDALGTYTKIGRQVTLNFRIRPNSSVAGSAVNATFGGVPFAINDANGAQGRGTVRYHGDAEAYIMQSNGTTQIQTSNTWGGINTITGQTQPVLTGTFIYFTTE